MSTTVQKKARSQPQTVSEEHRLSVFSASLGWFATAWIGGRLCDLTFGYKNPRQALSGLTDLGIDGSPDVQSTPQMEAFARRIQAYCDGHEDDFSNVPVALGATTEFQRRVLQHCRRIAYGRTLSYAELAAAAGSPRACRAVGNIMARNRIPLVIPCHRVVGSHGSLGGYSAWTGLEMKRRLLRLEGAEFAVK